MEYEITLKINSISSHHNEYVWEGKTMRSSRINPILLMKAEDELEVYDTVKKLSEGTLEIVSISEVDVEQRYVQQMVDLATHVLQPMTILALLQYRGVGIGLN